MGNGIYIDGQYVGGNGGNGGYGGYGGYGNQMMYQNQGFNGNQVNYFIYNIY